MNIISMFTVHFGPFDLIEFNTIPSQMRIKMSFISKNQDSSVSKVNGYGQDGQGSIPSRSRNFPFVITS
jgi:hypothetical protein